MKSKQAKIFASIIMVLVLLVICCYLAGCDSPSSELLPSAIIFADGNSITKKYGSGTYTNTVSGDGDGTISHASGTPAVAEVNASTGTITIRDTGTAVITAVKAATAVYASATNSYTLTVSGYEQRETGPAGGLIFYINPNPSASGWKYLEAGPQETENVYEPEVDQVLEWGTYNVLVGADGEEIGTGESNTAAIAAYLTEHPEGNYRAADWCDELSFGGYDDWFLPSIEELFAMYNILYISSIGGFYDGGYWSSTESESRMARVLLLTEPDAHHNGVEKDQAFHVRPIRAF